MGGGVAGKVAATSGAGVPAMTASGTRMSRAVITSLTKRNSASPRTSSVTLARSPRLPSGKTMVLKDGQWGPYVTDGEYNASLRKGDSVEELTDDRAAELHARGYYLVARFVVFPDDELAGYAGGTYALKDAYEGGHWQDERGFRWVSLWHPFVWDYNLDLAEEAVGAGFDEVQFDYIRFPSEEGAEAAVVPFWPAGTAKEEAITGFVRAAAERLRPLGAPVGADVFGFSCLYEKRNPEGQDVDAMAPYVDVFYPMAYPSHDGRAFYAGLGLRRRPYAIVFKTVTVARNRVELSGASVQPFIQGFGAGAAYYDATYIFDQMLAAEDAGAVGWVVWNADNVYTVTYEALELYDDYRYGRPWHPRPMNRNPGSN